MSIEENTDSLLSAIQEEIYELEEKITRLKNKKTKILTLPYICPTCKGAGIERRAEEIANEYNINKTLEKYYNLGLSTAYGYVMYMLDQDFDKKDIKKVIMNARKDDTQFRCDMFGAWGELMDKN